MSEQVISEHRFAQGYERGWTREGGGRSQGGDGWKKWLEIERQRVKEEEARERERASEDLRFLASFPERYTLLDKRPDETPPLHPPSSSSTPSSSFLDCTLGSKPALAFSHRKSRIDRYRERERERGTKGVARERGGRIKVRGRRALSPLFAKGRHPRGA